MGYFQSLWSEVTAIEMLLFLAMAILLMILVIFYRSSRAYSKMRNTSRCYNEGQVSSPRDIYTINATVQGRPAFDVTYNTMNSSTDFSCACPKGNIQNNFTNIPYYDLSSSTAYDNRVKVKDRLTCQCESDISAAANDPNVRYKGQSQIAIFMHNPEKRDFFDNMVYGANRQPQ